MGKTKNVQNHQPGMLWIFMATPGLITMLPNESTTINRYSSEIFVKLLSKRCLFLELLNLSWTFLGSQLMLSDSISMFRWGIPPFQISKYHIVGYIISHFISSYDIKSPF